MNNYEATRILMAFLGSPKEGSFISDGQLSFNCPRCQELNAGQCDHKHNLDVTFPGTTRPPLRATCWKCGYNESASQLLYAYASRDLLSQWKAYEATIPPIYRRQSRLKPKRAAELPDDFELVNEYSAEPHHRAAWAYLTQERQVPPARVRYLGFGVSQEKRWVGRVLLPSYDAGGELNFVIGRAVVDVPGAAPYQTSYGVDRKDIVYNEARIDWNQPVLLTEGIFDLAAYPHNCVPLLGKSLAAGGLVEQRLRRYRPPVIVGVDDDAVGTVGEKPTGNVLVSRSAGSREAILQRLHEIGIPRRFWLELPRNDLGDLLKHDGALQVPRLVQAAMRADKARE